MQTHLHTPMNTVGIEQGRNTLPQLASRAFAGEPSVLTKHGKPYAAIVPLEMLDAARRAEAKNTGFLALRGSGKGLWGAEPARLIAAMRDED